MAIQIQVTQKVVYMTYGYQMKEYENTFLKMYFSTRMDPKCHEDTRKDIHMKYGYQMKAYNKKCLNMYISTRIKVSRREKT